MNQQAVDIDVNTVAIAGFIIFALLSGFIVFFIILYRQMQAHHQREKERIRVEMERQQLAAQLEISEETMRRISMEIHDNVGQVLTLAKLQLNQITPEKMQEGLSNGRDLITRALSDLRNLSRSLNGQFLTSVNLAEALERELGLIRGTGVMECQLHVNTYIPTLSDRHQIMLFRCTQEAMSNAMKHSKGSQLIVDLSCETEILKVTVTDNGEGLDISAMTSGVGMKSLKERMEMIGGHFSINSAPGNGTSVVLTVPVQPENTQHA